ncbi:NAD(P)H-hydrate epimerase [Podospora fimiseda]|uniref:Enhancer of mRNA-decapping protein 3 n=1 Tax=Podospora fimiseda TaxID=252190 RepID=A0AAN7BLL0_9PEZI|nr:NAD(P)H-hydrate epimerase [Podospora fimiseda]
MASEFLGLLMEVVIRTPPGHPPLRLKGIVCDVEAGVSLTLNNVWNMNTNEWKHRVTILATDIADISQIPTVAPPAAAPPPAAPLSNLVVAAPQLPMAPVAAPPVLRHAPQQPAFVDPAIVAVGKRPSISTAAPLDIHRLPNTSEKRDPEATATPIVHSNTSRDLTLTVGISNSIKNLKLESNAAAVESVQEEVVTGEAVLDYEQMASQKRKRPQRRPRNPKIAAQEEMGQASSAQPVPKGPGKGKGWRQTPMLENSSSFQPFKSLKKTVGRNKNDNGWASEDVTDVQEMGDFDFEQELAKFDKNNLFEQMRKDDQIDASDRLVSHNRLPRPKPGTGGGKNYHHTENVLDSTPPVTILKKKGGPLAKEQSNDFWNSEADDGVVKNGERASGRDLAMGSRQSSRRGESTRRSQSRKASTIQNLQSAGPSKLNASVSHHRASSLKGSRPSSRLSGRIAATTDKRKQHSAPASHESGFYMVPSNRRVETISPLQMLNIENIAKADIGFTEDIMIENASRGIAEVTLTALSDPAIKVRHAGTVDPSTGAPPPKTVVVLAGNNKSGARAVAAARHLRNKGINVLVCVVGLERGERDLLEEVHQQVRLYKNLGGRVFNKNDFFEHIRKISMPMLTIDTPRMPLSSLANPAPVMLIVDALLGLAISFDELRNGDQATVYELVEWANRNEAFVLAVDVPTGIDPSTGVVSVVDGNRLYVKPRYVVSVAAPKKGLLEAMIAAPDTEEDSGDGSVMLNEETVLPSDDPVLEWKLFLVDMGLAPAVWKKAGTKMRKGVDFADRWVVEMRYKGVGSANGQQEEEDEEEI